MYRLLIAEDDSIERDALVDLVDWQALNLRLAGSAESPEEAIDMTYAAGFDLLLADIRQPGMTGSELAQALLANQPRMKAIVCGEQGSEQSAMRRIARPIGINELKAALAAAVKELDDELAGEGPAERLRQAVRSRETALRRHFFDRLITGSLSDGELLKGLEHFGVAAVQGRFAMMLVELDGFDRLSISMDWEALQMALEAVREAVTGLGLEGLLDCAYLERGRFGVLLDISKAGRAAETRQALLTAEKIRCAALTAGFSVTVAVGSTVARLRDLRQSFRTAASALAVKGDWGRGQVVSHADGAAKEYDPSPVDLAAIEESLALALQTAGPAEARASVDRLFNAARRKSWEITRLGAASLRVLAGVQCLLRDLGEPDEAVMEGGAVWHALIGSATAPAMAAILNRCVERAAQQLQLRRESADRELVRRAMEWLTGRVEKPVTAAELSQALNCSPSYVGAAFRRHTGKTLAICLRDMRLEKALELLQDPANRIGEIAIRVGYPNVSGFCALFKRKFGMNPGEYREGQRAKG